MSKHTSEKVQKAACDASRHRRFSGALSRKTLTIVIICLAAVIILGAASFAIYSAIMAGWEQEVHIESFTFSLNGKPCDKVTINSNDLLLAKGQEVDFVMSAKVDGYATNRFCVPFQITITLVDKDQDSKDVDTALARAIEIYRYDENNEYVYVGMLNELVASGYKIGDISDKSDKTKLYSAVVGVNGSVDYRYKLVYSPGAGDYYENTSFTLNIKAEHSDPAYANTKYYVYTSDDLKKAQSVINAQETPELTIVLLNNITLDQSIAFTKKVGIDVNGHTLATEACSISITDNSSYALGTAAAALAISDSAGGGSITGNGITYSSSADIIRVADSFSGSAGVTVANYSLGVLNAHLAASLEEFCRTPVASGATTVDFTKGYKIYLRDGEAALSVTDTDIVASIANGIGTLTRHEMTTGGYVQLSLTKSGSTFTTSSSYMTVLGTNAYSVATQIADKIPSKVTSSLFLPVYDAKTGAHITWSTSDKALINSDGVFLPDGYTGLSSYQNTSVDLGLVIETAGGERYTTVVTREVGILSPEERTRLLYSFPELVLKDIGSTLDVTAGILDSKVNIGVIEYSLREMLGFQAAGITVDVATIPNATAKNINFSETTTDNDVQTHHWFVNYSGAQSTLTYNAPDGTTNNELSFNTSLVCETKPTTIGALIVPSTITFYYYEDAANTRLVSYEIEREILVLGTDSILTRNDATVSLQPSFTSNKYIDKVAYSFLADGSYDDGRVLVEYHSADDTEATKTQWHSDDIIEIVNGIYVEDATGAFYRDGNNFKRYESTTAGNSTRYSRKCLIIVKPANIKPYTDVAPITAKLINIPEDGCASTEYINSAYLTQTVLGDAYGRTVYRDTIGDGTYADKTYLTETISGETRDVEYDLSLVVEGIYHIKASEIADANLYNKLLGYYDYNADGYIGVSEALREPGGCNINGVALVQPSISYGNNNKTGTTYDYLDFAGLNISSLKGIEYFENVTGLNFNSSSSTAYNSIINITYLSQLYELKCLGLKNNLVADISSLSYLDKLEYIDLSNSASIANKNNITDLSPIKYLPAVKYLNLENNSNIADIEPTEKYTSLTYLNVTGCGNAVASIYGQYYLTRIYSNSAAGLQSSISGCGIYLGSKYTRTAEQIAAAEALSNLSVIDETFNTIHLKTAEKLGDTTRYFRYLSDNTTHLDFLNASNVSSAANWSQTTQYSIKSPTVDLPIIISIFASIPNEREAAAEADFYADMARPVTINLLQLSGHANMTYIECADGIVRVASTVVPDSALLNLLFSKFNTATSDSIYVGADNKILESGTNETKISNAQIVTQAEINVAGVSLTGTNSPNGVTNLAGISNFAGTTSGCGIIALDLRGNTLDNADISELSTLKNLEDLYLNGQSYDFTQLSKFAESSTQLTGYDYFDAGKAICGSGLTSLKNLSVFGCYGLDENEVQKALYGVYLMNKDVDIYLSAEYTGTTVTANIWDPYAVPLAKYINSLPSTFTYVELGAKTECMYVDDNGVMRLNSVKDGTDYYYNFYFYETLHIKVRISAHDIKGQFKSSISGVKYNTNYISGFNYTKLVGYTDTEYSILTLSGTGDAAFTSDVDVGRSSALVGTHYVEQRLEFNNKIKIMVYGDTNEYTINELFPGRDLLVKVMGAYTLQSGTYKFKVKNISTNISTYVAPTLRGGTLLLTLEENQVIDIGDSLSSTGLFLAGGKSSAQGLQYTSVTKFTFIREAILGDGSWLQNLTELTIGYSAVDLGTITKECKKLTKLTLGSTACWDVSMYDSGIYDVWDTDSDLFRYVIGLDPTSDFYTKVKNGVDVSSDTPQYLPNASLQKLAMGISADEASKETMYNALRDIVRSRDAEGKYYFYLNYFPGLTTFSLQNTPVYDWTGLLAFMFNSDEGTSGTYYDASNLATLTIYGATDGSRNSNGGVCEPIVKQIYEAYKTSKDTSPTYKIGTLADNKATANYNPDTWHDKSYSHDANYSNYFTLNNETYVRKTRLSAQELAEFASKVLDLGVEITDPNDASKRIAHYNSATQTINSGESVYLPTTTKNTMFSSNLAVTDEVFYRDLPITWKTVSGIASNALTETAVSGTPDNGYTEVTPTAANSNGNYIVYVGTITETDCKFYYPVLVANGTADTDSYGNFTDPQFRLFVFLATGGDSSTIKSRITSLSDSDVPSAYRSLYSGIRSLDGIGILSSLTTLDIQGNFISDCSDLSSCTSLTSVKLSNNLISDVSWACSLNLTTLELSNNAIKTTYNETGTFLPNTLTTLKLDGNDCISLSDVEKMTTLTALTTLWLNGTSVSHDPAVLEKLIAVLEASNSVLLKLSNDTEITATAATLTNAKALVYGTAASEAYKEFINPASTYGVTRGATEALPSFAGLTVTIPSTDIYSDGAWASWIDSKLSFKAIATLDDKETFNSALVFYIDAYVDSYQNNTYSGLSQLPLAFKDSDGNDITATGIDTAIYAYLRNNNSGVWSGILSNNTWVISYTSSDRSLTFPTDLGITTLAGIDKIPGLKTVSIQNNPIRTLGFTTNSSITSFSLAGAVLSTADAAASLAHLTAMTSIDLTHVSGIDYTRIDYTRIDYTTVADVLTGINSLKTIKINNAYNYTSDYDFLYSASEYSFGSKAISTFEFGKLIINKAYTACTTSSPVEKDFFGRNATAKAYQSALWWNGNAYAGKFALNFIDTFAVIEGTGKGATIQNGKTTPEFAWNKLLSYMSDKTVTATGRVAIPGTIYEDDLTGADPAYANRSQPFTFTLPASTYVFGTKYSIAWSAVNHATETGFLPATGNLSTLFTTANGYTTLTFSEETLNSAGIPTPDNATGYNGTKLTITATAKGDRKTWNYSFDIIVKRTLPVNYYNPISKSTLITTFFIEMEDGEIVQANQFFTSYRLLYWIYNNTQNHGLIKDKNGAKINPIRLCDADKYNNNAKKVEAETSVYTGKYLTLSGSDYYLSYAQVCSVYNIRINNDSKDNAIGGGIGISSIDGIDLFKNLKTLRIDAGYPTSIEAVRNLRLESFSYYNYNNGANPIVQDWTPLYNSRDTLTTFEYAIYGDNNDDRTLYHDDFSFLMSFSSLKNVKINTDKSNASVNVNKMPGFKYYIAWLAKNSKDCTVTFNGTQIYKDSVINDPGITAEIVAAEITLEKFTGTDDADIDYANNFELFLRSSAKTDTNGTIKAKLPGYINDGGHLYPIEWVSMSSFIEVSYSKPDSTGTTDLTGQTEDEAYFGAYDSSNTWTMTLTGRKYNYLSNAYLIARVMIDGSIYERVLTLNCADNNIYPSITLRNNFATYTLGSGAFTYYDTESAGYYTLTDSEKTLVLKPGAIGNEVYVNVDGVRTRVYFDLGAEYFDRIDNSTTGIYPKLLAKSEHLSQISTDYPYSDKATSIQAINNIISDYDSLTIGEWIYTESAHTNTDDISAYIVALKKRLALLEFPEYTITYSGPNGFSHTNIGTWNVNSPTTLNDATLENSIFLGWYADSSFTQPITELSMNTLAGRNTNLTIYARFFTGGTINYQTDSDITLTSNSFPTQLPEIGAFSFNFSAYDAPSATKSDSTTLIYRGAYSDASFNNPINGVSYTDFINGRQTLSEITVYLRFTLAPMTVNYNLNQADTTGLTNLNTITSYEPTSSTITLANVVIGPTSTLFSTTVFDGWYNAATGGTKVEAITSADFISGGTLKATPHRNYCKNEAKVV